PRAPPPHPPSLPAALPIFDDESAKLSMFGPRPRCQVIAATLLDDRQQEPLLDGEVRSQLAVEAAHDFVPDTKSGRSFTGRGSHRDRKSTRLNSSHVKIS